MAVLPLGWQSAAGPVERACTVLALFYFFVAIGQWLGMGRRALAIAGISVVVLYGLATVTDLVTVGDFYSLTLLVGFLIFILAGFNLVFILEEVVYDIHRHVQVRSLWWALLPLAGTLALVPAVWLAKWLLGWSLPTLGLIAPFLAILILIAWALQLFVPGIPKELLRETHLVIAGAAAAAGVADAVVLLRGGTGLVPSILAYLGILGTWLFISFTTLQRAHYFLGKRDVLPWVALLLSSSFAIVAHVYGRFRFEGQSSLNQLIDVRVWYLAAGIWIGIVFMVLRGLWRVFGYLRDDRQAGQRTRMVAARLARVTEQALDVEHRVGDAAYRVFERVDRVVPGPNRPPSRPEYRIGLVDLDDESE